MKIYTPLILAALIAAAGLTSCGGNNSGKSQGSDIAITSQAGDSTLAELAGQSQEAVTAATQAESEAQEEAQAEAAEDNTPVIQFLSSGSILPSKGELNLLFGAKGYAKAQIRVKKVYSDNILQFLQFESYESRYNLYKVADVISDTTVVLGAASDASIREYRTYGLDLSEMVRPEPGAIYHVEIRGREPLVEEDFWDSDSYFGNYETYEQRSVDLLASNITMVARHGDKGYGVTVMDILSGKSVSGARVKLYSFSQQELAKGQTDASGNINFPAVEEAAFAVATSGKNYAYLKLDNGNALSTSSFDVSGKDAEDGIKAYIFGERGVWRPGDTLHISTIFMGDGVEIPVGHPVTAELCNPDGQITQTLSGKIDRTHICHFPFTTPSDAPTGRWNVTVKLGGHSFEKTLRVETVKPNNLDINLKFDKSYITPSKECTGVISVDWLYGAVGSKLKVNGSVTLSAAGTRFKGYDQYSFTDAARSFSSQTLNLGDMTTDDRGETSINTYVKLNKATTPGMLNASFTINAFEPGGGFSTASSSIRMSPFDSYVGLYTAMDKDEWGNEYLRAGKPHTIEVVTLDADGKGVSVGELQAEIYLIQWSWWWNASYYAANYNSGKMGEKVFSTTLSTSSGKGKFSFDWPAQYPSGPYVIRVSDPKGGHSATLMCEVFDERSASDASEEATKLNMLLDKEKYTVGETAGITIPSAAGSFALVSIERGGRILSTRRVECSKGSTRINIPVTAEMAPNVYANISLIQPHGNATNDAPIRLYGIANINVEDASSHLRPQIDIADEVRPESKVRFSVKEKDGRAMSYVVALVDEGLLNLTGFKTPDAWKSFYAKQSLRVRTWDSYDKIIGAYGGQIEKLFAIGGGDEGSGAIKPQKANRFTPVVRYLGPFELGRGKTAQHSVYVPQYIGSLRAMVIATDGRAQGSTEKYVTVSKPLMTQITLPRTLSTGESLSVPVSVITLNDGVGEVKLSAKTSGSISLSGESTQSIRSDKAGAQLAYFDIKVGDRTGVSSFSVTAQSSGDKSAGEVEIDVVNPNPQDSRASVFTLAAGEKKDISAELSGIDGSNSLSVELSSIPPVNLGKRLTYLLEYPYGCVEQTISAAFPQLYLGKIQDCSESQLKACEFNVSAAINRLPNYLRSDGSLSYWPDGHSEKSNFGTVYALHFLQEAADKGYAVNAELKSGLIKYISKNIVNSKAVKGSVRAYGLYALAAAGKPERSAMNNLRGEVKNLQNSSVWLLAAAYAIDGKKSVAESLISGLPYSDDPKKEYSSFGSEERNLAIALKVNMILGKKTEAMELATKLAGQLNDDKRYMSTQATAWSLYAMSGYAASLQGSGVRASLKAGSESFTIDSDKCLVSKTICSGADKDRVALKLENKGKDAIHVVVAASGIPAAGQEVAKASGLKMQVAYRSADGGAIQVDTLSAGRNFKAVVTVTNTGSSAIDNIALSHKFPSGWEIQNDRIYLDNYSYPAGIDYQDFRDDRVDSFFSLAAGRSVTVTVNLTAAYRGRFYLPAVSCEAMYDDTVSALVPGKWIEVR